MILEPGCVVLISHRRLFEDDSTRHFIGVVEAFENPLIRASGYTWIRDHIAGTFHRKHDLRTKVFSLSTGSLICYQLPSSLEPSKLKYENRDLRLWLTDGDQFNMDVSESEYPKKQAPISKGK